MTSYESDSRKHWQKATWIQLLAIAIGVLPSYISTILSYLQSGQPLSVKGAVIYSIVLGGIMMLSNPIHSMFPSEPQSGSEPFFSEIVQNPWLFALVMGPVLIIGAGVFEELTRVFLLTRLWNISSNKVWKWMAVILSAVLFGLNHIYQGPAGVIMTGISGLIMAIYYLFFGRIAAMITAHYLHDALQLAIIYIMANAS